MGRTTILALLFNATLIFPVATSESKPLLVIVDGAGDYKGCSTAIANAVEANELDVAIEVFPWSHGRGKVLQDQTDVKHSQAKGKELAEYLLAKKKEVPERPLILICHSAGSAVCLTASILLPADFLQRHILLAPSVSPQYDIQAALRSSRNGLDVFCSKQDCLVLGLAIRVFRSADEQHDRRAAGRHGFELTTSKVNAALLARLNQRFWSPEDEKLGHDGKHTGMFADAWIEKNLFPLCKLKNVDGR